MPISTDRTGMIDRETAWLAFSDRVLQEASDPTVPLLERLFFCGIFSSNLDEFFRVRVASLRSLLRLGTGDASKLGISPHRLLHDIHRIVLAQQERYGGILNGLYDELASEGIVFANEKSVDPAHEAFLRETFRSTVAPLLEPVPLRGSSGTPFLKNNRIYLAVELWDRGSSQASSWTPAYHLIEVPTGQVSRFVTLPSRGGAHEVMFLDDLIRYNLRELFPEHDVGRSYAVKLTRDAELHVEDHFEGDLVAAIRKSLANRETGLPSRFLYDMRAPYVLVHRLQHELQLEDEDFVLGARYHNLSDYVRFPRFGRADLSYPPWPALPHPTLDAAPSVLELVGHADQIIHTPYQSFGHFIRFLDEAAEDPNVEAIALTVYRVASDSGVLATLVKAAENGKTVTVFVEVQARFDEQTNLEWATRLEEAGVRTLYSMPGLKVHAKIALVTRREVGETRLYGYIGTGNFNEKTAGVYADHGVFTADERITTDLDQVFRFLTGEIAEPELHHLLVAPFTLRKSLTRLVRAEAEAAAAGREAGITLKLNALEDPKVIEELYDASAARVPIDVIVRGICRLVQGVPNQSDTIRLRSILDRYLEHARIYAFHAGGEERMYLASADWMHRNLSSRVEVAIPVYDPEVRRQLRTLLDLQLADNCKARSVEPDGTNPYLRTDGKPVRAQEAFREFLSALTAGDDRSPGGEA
ncbi:MAG: polyphosphate kinase 1 [Gemmatimonadota bacterium]